MPRVRAGYTGKYKLSKHGFYTAYHYALQYNDWMDEYNNLADSSTDLRYGHDEIWTDNDKTERHATRRNELRDLMSKVEDAAAETDPELSEYILLGVTNEGVTFDVLQTKYDIPLSRNRYYDRRRKFYFILSQKIN